MASSPNKLSEAFKEGGNLVGLTGVIAASVALLSPLPLIVGLVAEAAYLLFVPDSGWYTARLSKRHDGEIEARRAQLRAQIFAAIDEGTQERFTRLENIRSQITDQTKKDEKWFLEVLRKLDYLLEKFLMFAGKEAEFRRYLVSLWQDEVSKGGSGGQSQKRNPGLRIAQGGDGANYNLTDDRIPQMVTEIQDSFSADVAKLQASADAEADRDTKAVMQKRIDVIQQRREGAGKIGRILTNLRYQLALVEDTFGLINDQIRARSPEQVLSDIEGVVYQADSMTSMLEELAPFEQIAA